MPMMMLVRYCVHHQQDVPLQQALIYCIGLAVAFVASLYVIVPHHIRSLPRDDPHHIQWRAFATGVVALLAWISYPYLFCHDENNKDDSVVSFESVLQWIQREVVASVAILLHTWMLYFGPLLQYALHILLLNRRIQKNATKGLCPPPASFLSTCYTTYWKPTLYHVSSRGSPQQRWILLRTLLVAPLTEEVVFRGCMVPLWVRAVPRVAHACWYAPCVFGIAHVHHAVVRWHNDTIPKRTLLLVTVAQFLYTTLFGAYVSYAYWKRESILAVIVCHAWCNAMGLPDVATYHAPTSHLYPYRHVLQGALGMGIVGFCVLGWVVEWLP